MTIHHLANKQKKHLPLSLRFYNRKKKDKKDFKKSKSVAILPFAVVVCLMTLLRVTKWYPLDVSENEKDLNLTKSPQNKLKEPLSEYVNHC